MYKVLRKLSGLFLLTVAVGLPIVVQAQIISCREVLSKSRVLDFKALQSEMNPTIQSILEQIQQIPPEVLAGKAVPAWENFQKLESAFAILAEAQKKFKDDPELIIEFNGMAKEFRKMLATNEYFQNVQRIRKENASSSLPAAYKPTEYEMKLAFQQYLGKINRDLPKELRLPVARIKFDQRRQQVNATASKLISETLTPAFDKVFPTTGYATYAEFEIAIRKSEDPLVKRAIELLDKDQIELAVRRPQQARFWIPKTGFQNQFVTKSSKGTLSYGSRNLAENKLFAFNDLTNYSELDPEVKPKYGTIRPKPETKLTSANGSSSQYGEDFYIIKTAEVADRLTVYPTDSLYPGRNSDGLSWRSHLIPWSRRLFMVPFMLKEIESKTLGIPRIDEQRLLKDVQNFRSPYWEIQIAGTLRLSNVEKFIFTHEAPSGEFLRELRQNDIQIMDGRVEPPTPWVEPAR